MAAVAQWTGREAALLGVAMRLSTRAYASKLGVDQRTVCRWRKHGESVVLADETQQMLDTVLRNCDAGVLETFEAALGILGGTASGRIDKPPAIVQAGSALLRADLPSLGPAQIVSHKFVPVYLGSQLARLLARGIPRDLGPAGLGCVVLPSMHGDADEASRLHVYECGVAVFHLVQPIEVSALSELAEWRYRTYATDLEWARSRLAELLGEEPSRVPDYVLSAYELTAGPWTGEHLVTAMQLLTTPSVLADREHPEGPRQLGEEVERALFASAYEVPEAVDFGCQAVSMGLAGWSGVSYYPLAAERALPMQAIVALELDVQTLWALSSFVLEEIEAGRDPVMPEQYGWRWLRGVYSRLTAARPQETAQHQLMREAILATSQLPDRLRAAQEALREAYV